MAYDTDLEKKIELTSGDSYANSFVLKESLKAKSIDVPIYIDYNDEFDLFSVITDESEGYFEITQNDLKEK